MNLLFFFLKTYLPKPNQKNHWKRKDFVMNLQLRLKWLKNHLWSQLIYHQTLDPGKKKLIYFKLHRLLVLLLLRTQKEHLLNNCNFCNLSIDINLIVKKNNILVLAAFKFLEYFLVIDLYLVNNLYQENDLIQVEKLRPLPYTFRIVLESKNL